MTMYSWSPDRRASRSHIREAIRYALWERNEIGGKSDAWYKRACIISQRWRDHVRATPIKTLAREHLEYWRLRAFLGSEGGGSYAPRGWPADRPAFERWQAHT
jgi:hypothetical protein